MSNHRHHLPLVTVQRHDGKVKVCPHCQKEVTPESIYRDAKGWCFHRPCFQKGKGSIDLEKEASLPGRVAGAALLGGALGASRRIPYMGPATGALLGATTGLASDYIIPSVSPAEADPLAKLPPDRQDILRSKMKNITDTLGREGTYTGTFHKRVVVPHEYISPQDLQDLGFMRSRIAVPERGQTEFTTWRHPHNLYHFHTHPTAMTVHEDFFPSMDMLRYGTKPPLQRLVSDMPRGLGHVLTEGVPGYLTYIKNHIRDLFSREDKEEAPEVTPGSGKKPRGMVRSILKENPKAVVKDAEAPVVYERQTNDYNCGPAALKAVENSMGVGHPDQQSYEAETGANDKDGTPVINLEQTAANHGLNVDSNGPMDINKLQQLTQSGKPVIVAVQLDGQEGGPKGGWNSGHYIVVKDVSNGQVRFMDPNADVPERAWPIDEFLSRWHDHDHNGKVYNQWGMALYQPGEPKVAAEGALGSGAGQSQTTVPPQMLDGSGATPAGNTDMQPASDEKERQEAYLDCCERDPDPSLFDVAALSKAATSPMDVMSVGTEETQEPLDDTLAQWTGSRSHNAKPTTSWKDRLLSMVNRFPAYQDSGTAEAGGRAFAPSSPTFQSGVSIQQQPGLSAPEAQTEPDDTHMQLDSDSNSTGQLKHLNA